MPRERQEATFRLWLSAASICDIQWVRAGGREGMREWGNEGAGRGWGRERGVWKYGMTHRSERIECVCFVCMCICVCVYTCGCMCIKHNCAFVLTCYWESEQKPSVSRSILHHRWITDWFNKKYLKMIFLLLPVLLTLFTMYVSVSLWVVSFTGS